MARTGAKHTQADIARALRALKQAGMQKESQVEARPDGTIVIAPLDKKHAGTAHAAEPEHDIVL
ncbi:hypothetical protein [Ancylobacter sp. FA202]|uniref:hypothetical protein n=1 Tax=unclassified Ancylobacter TaxID=2626613 RepID=UPI0003657FC8|nr:hypothetical protein [Ancylobacter sp. FA202]